MAYTNSGLVKHCRDALKLKTKYMWGGLFRELTDAYVDQLAGMYPYQYTAARKITLKGLAGKGYYGCDCIGLVKSYYFGGVGAANNAKGYDGSKDYNVGGMYNAAKVKGEILTMPQTEGILVMTADFGHVGVYIGGGQVIECTLGSRGDGVVQTALAAGGWAYWCQCPCIADDTGKSASVSTAKVVSSNAVYKSLGVAAMRKGASFDAELSSRCVKGNYYPASQIVNADGVTKWLRHVDSDLYSALTDTPASGGGKLFEQVGTYTVGKADALVNVRAAAGLNGIKLAQLKAGDTVYVVDKVTKKADGLTWVQVVYNGGLAWLDGQWVV